MKAKYGLPQKVEFCSRCVMSNQRPNSQPEYWHVAASKKETIRFVDGVCEACRVAEAKKSINWPSRELELLELLDQHRGRGDFDCVVPGSGGKDSFYAAHVLKVKYGMRPLLVTWAPHLATEWGVRNLERMQAVSDHVMVTPDRNVHRLLTRLAVDNLFHPFQPFIIGQKSIAAKVALQYGVKLVFYGENEAEYGNPMGTNTAQRSSDYHAAGGRLHLSGMPLEDIRREFGVGRRELATYLPASEEAISDAGVDVRYLGYYLRWHPQSCYYYAVEHGGFEAAPERTPGTYSKYNSIDDKMDDLHYYTTWVKFGIGRASYDAAQEIRSGDITREEGVALVHRFDGEWPARFEPELWDYLSVDGFPPMTKDRFLLLADSFKSEHLWNGDRLRHVVA